MNERMLDIHDEEVAQLRRELLGVQEMLFFVLKAIDKPVMVTKESMVRENMKDQMINIEDDLQRDAFIFSVSEIPSEVVDAGK